MTDRAEAAEYMRANRAAWKDAGFVERAIKVHNDDRQYVIAYANIMRFERLLAMLKAEDPQAFDLMSERNMPALPTMVQVQAVQDMLDLMPDGPMKQRATAMYNAAIKSLKSYRAHHYAWVESERTDDAARAKYVTHGNLVSAYLDYAEAVAQRTLTKGK